MHDSQLWRCWSAAVKWLSGEWLLTDNSRKRLNPIRPARPNGGPIVLARALVSSFALCISVSCLREVSNPQVEFLTWNWTRAREIFVDSIPMFGAILAATYTALYTRFASQWKYLAGVYNQIKAAETSGAYTAAWKAGFIEDADDLYLTSKPMFASTVRAWARDPDVRAAFRKDTVGGGLRLNHIRERAERACHRAELEIQLVHGRSPHAVHPELLSRPQP